MFTRDRDRSVRFALGIEAGMTHVNDHSVDDTFRYLDQLGRLARQNVAVVFHNTLASSDYGLLDENSYQPKPNFWGALLWRRLMGSTVLDPGVVNGPGLHVFAHCLRGAPGGLALLLLNTDRLRSRSLTLPVAALRHTLTALPQMAGAASAAGQFTLEPASITFLAVVNAQNQACG